MDQHEQLISESQIAYSVLGRGEEFILVNLAEDIEYAKAEAVAKHYAWCGTLTVSNGRLCCALCDSSKNPGALYTMMFAGLKFAHMVADRLVDQAKGDSVEWLQKLHRLPDTRQSN